ncbi:MAG TPA: DUF134 domain-containing protein [Firmicutes bacterium]|nr:DUF134 domain-containing protein [Candidatus Fermentithermobacillaceae bacterium]
MPRPTKPRWVEFVPCVTYFKPAGVPMSQLAEVTLGVDEAEAIRLKDYVGLEQEECAIRMNLAQSTFQRILTEARGKVAQALVNGKALRIEGGNYLVSPFAFECHDCSYEWSGNDKTIDEMTCPKCGGSNLGSFRKVPVGETYGGFTSGYRRGRRGARHRRGRMKPD